VDAAAEFLVRWHYVGLFAIILIEEAGVPLPVPGDLFIAAMGFLAYRGQASFLPTAALVTAATVTGAGFLYLLSRRLGRPLLLRMARRFGYDAAREARVEAWMARRGPVAIVVGRLIPGLRIVMTVVAGVLRVDARMFAVGTTVAGVVWATLYFWAGWLAGHGYGTLRGAALPVWPLAAAAGLTLAALAVWKLRFGRRPDRPDRE
jgi:membrane protein DedA with SNARE-associated domain